MDSSGFPHYILLLLSSLLLLEDHSYPEYSNYRLVTHDDVESKLITIGPPVTMTQLRMNSTDVINCINRGARKKPHTQFEKISAPSPTTAKPLSLLIH